MTNVQLVNEFKRWVEAGKPKVWFKRDGFNWSTVENPTWRSDCVIYIVDDKHAELRKLQIDEPNTKFEVYNELKEEWEQVICYYWDVDSEYRVKPKEWYFNIPDEGIICFVSNIPEPLNNKRNIAIVVKYDECETSGYRFFDITGMQWLFAEPITYNDLYQSKIEEK